MLKKVLFFLALASVLLHSAGAANMDLKWEYETGTKDKSVHVEDLESGWAKELVIATNNNVYVLESNGELRREMPIENLVSVCISDLEWDEKKEIIVSSGKSIGNVARGSIWIFDNDGELRWLFPPGKVESHKILRGIKAVDMDGNGYKEIVGGTTGGVATLADNYNEFLWYTHLNKSITGISTGLKGWILANSHSDLFLMNFDGSVEWNYGIPGGIKKVYLADFYPAAGEEIVVVSLRGSIYVLDMDGVLEAQVNITQESFDAIPANLDDDGYDEILLISDEVAYARDITGRVSWDYNVSGKIIGVRLADTDHDGKDSILLFTEKHIYKISLDGEFECRYDPGLAHGINDMIIDNLEYDGEDEFIIDSAGRVYIFNINQSKVEKEAADSHYRKAYDYFTFGEYKNASIYVEKARDAYQKLDDNENLLRCMVLVAKIKAGVREEKKSLAEDCYRKAEYHYNNSLYENAGIYLKNATMLFRAVGDLNGIIKCNSLSGMIRDATRTAETTTSIPDTSTSILTTSVPLETTLVTVPVDGIGNDLVGRIPALLVVLIIVLVIISIRKRRVTLK